MNAPVPAPRLWSLEEYEQMIDAGILDENDKVELIAGEILQKVTQNSPHATAVTLGHEALRVAVGEGFHIRVQMPIALYPDSEPEPDLVVVSGSPRDYRDGHPRTAHLVIEVADTTLAYDRMWKGSIYARAGIPEYWIVNLVEKSLEVYRDPGLEPAARLGYGYRERLRFGAGSSVSTVAVPHAEVLVGDLLP